MAVLALAMSAVACSDDGEDGTGLLAALGKVRASDEAARFVEYGDSAQVRTLLEADQTRFLSFRGYGYSDLANVWQPVRDKLGYDLTASDGAIRVGEPPKWASILWGDYDVDQVNARFAEFGARREERDGGTFWISAEDYEIDLAGPYQGVIPLNQFNAVRTQAGSFAYAPAQETLAWVTDPGEETLAGNPEVSSLARCLGDVAVATMVKPEGQRDMLAVGVRAPSADEVTAVVCSGGVVTERKDQVADRLANDTVPSTRQPWSRLIPDPTVEVTGFGDFTALRITGAVPRDVPVNWVLTALAKRDLEALLR